MKWGGVLTVTENNISELDLTEVVRLKMFGYLPSKNFYIVVPFSDLPDQNSLLFYVYKILFAL